MRRFGGREVLGAVENGDSEGRFRSNGVVGAKAFVGGAGRGVGRVPNRLCRWGSNRIGLQRLGDGVELRPVRVRGGERQPDLARADAHPGGDLQPADANGAALRLGPARAGQAQPTQPVHEHIGEGGEVQPQLVGASLRWCGRRTTPSGTIAVGIPISGDPPHRSGRAR